MTVQTRQVPKTVQESVVYLLCDGLNCQREVEIGAPRKYVSTTSMWTAFPDGYVLAAVRSLIGNPGDDNEYLNFCSIECLSVWALSQALEEGRANEREQA